MGVERSVEFTGEMPRWETIQQRLDQVGLSVVIRMIDGLPAFPNEVPEATWQELRLGTPTGMVTLRRSNKRLNCIVWGNADDSLLKERDQIIWACADAGSGMVIMPDGSVSADTFRQRL